MTEAAGGGTRTEMGRTIVQRSIEDEDFRQRLLDAPKAAIEQELGVGFPAEVQVRAVQESADTIYLVLPSTSAAGEVGELSERELEEVAGGGDTFIDYTCGGMGACDGGDSGRGFLPTQNCTTPLVTCWC
jgi:hypothetical protein